jgi:DNA-binding CsgD family transcriptional regulator
MLNQKRLTNNQQFILRLMSEGKTAKEIALAKSVAEQTIKTTLYKLYKRIGAKNAPHAVAMWLRGELQ